MSAFRTLLVTTDFSETSKLAFPLVRSLAEKRGSRIVVVYVQEDVVPLFAGEYAQTSIQSILDDQREHIAGELKRLAVAQIGAGTETETLVVSGTPHLEIVRLASEWQVDLIVMATHGRGFLGHTLFGSTTERVLRRAPCPVLTVRGPGSSG